jgi:hypothetical protein
MHMLTSLLICVKYNATVLYYILQNDWNTLHICSQWLCSLRRRSVAARLQVWTASWAWMFIFVCLLCAAHLATNVTSWSLIQSSPTGSVCVSKLSNL